MTIELEPDARNLDLSGGSDQSLSEVSPLVAKANRILNDSTSRVIYRWVATVAAAVVIVALICAMFSLIHALVPVQPTKPAVPASAASAASSAAAAAVNLATAASPPLVTVIVVLVVAISVLTIALLRSTFSSAVPASRDDSVVGLLPSSEALKALRDAIDLVVRGPNPK